MTKQDIYSIKDSINNIVTNDIGTEIIETYIINENGKTKLLDKKVNEKDFARAFLHGIN